MSTKSRSLTIAALFALAFSALAFPALAQGALSEPPSASLLEDAAEYSRIFDVSLDEAVQRLRLQVLAGELSAELAEEERGRFAGLWIEHVPQFQVVTRFVGAPAVEPQVRQRVAGTALAPFVDVRRAARSLEALEEHMTVARHVVQQHGFVADLSIDVQENRVEVLTRDARGLRNAIAASRVQLPAGVEVVEVEELPQPEATLIGGTTGSGCTGGFTVRRSSNGDLGIATAAHCGNSQYYLGSSLPFRSEDQQGNQDVQWHSACGIHTVTNQFNSGIGTRSVIGTRSRDQQAVGSLVCKFGATTGRTCGILQSKTYAPHWVTSAASTFIYVDGDQVGTNLSEGGDSGGPWFVEDYAYGIHSGGGGNDSIYMPINYISSLGVSVLTYNPGACNLAPFASFTYTSPYDYRADFNASASYDSDGSIVSYFWDFGDGLTQTTTSATVSHFYSAGGSYPVTLRVTDDDGATSYAYRLVNVAGDCDTNYLEAGIIIPCEIQPY